MGDVFSVTRAIIEELEDLTPPERGRVIGTLIALQGDTVTVQLGASPASEPPPSRSPKAPGATQFARSNGSVPTDGEPGALELLPRLLETLKPHPSGMTNAELQTELGVSRKAVARALLAARTRGLIQGSSMGLGCRHSLTRKGQQG